MGRVVRHTARVVGFAALLAAAVPATARAADDAAPQLLESFPAGDQAQRGPRPVYTLSLRRCENGSCPFQVGVRAGSARDRPGAGKGRAATERSALLEWPASAAPAQAQAAIPGAELIRPVAAAAPQVWSTGQEEGTVAVAATVVPLVPDEPARGDALLVAQMAGFEHPKRRHALYVAASGAPKLAWSRNEQQGPYASWVVVPAGSTPVYVAVLFSADDAVADTVSAWRLKWAAQQQAFVEEPAAPVLLAVVAGAYPSLHAARAARDASPCFAGYAAVDTWPDTGVLPQRYALIALAVAPAQVAVETARLAQCQAGILARSYPLGRLSPRSFSSR